MTDEAAIASEPSNASTPLQAANPITCRRRKLWLRTTLRDSQKEAAASATMTASNDNFLNAFALHLQATATQMGTLTALPQFAGALMQLLSVWLGTLLPRRPMVITIAALQAIVVGLIALLAAFPGEQGFTWLIVLAVSYHACLNLIQPQWRAWMGSIVPQRRRGAFFAGRTRLTMITSLVVFLSGGMLLNAFDLLHAAGLGFTVLFLFAAIGRGFSSYYLYRMHDPDVREPRATKPTLRQTFSPVYHSLQDTTFRNYTFFVAGMQGVVAISAPFFAVYMLTDLQFTYFQFCLNQVVSVATQFLTLGMWGRLSDRYGNRLVMTITSCLMPVIPTLWLFSPEHLYLLVIQVLAGFAWSGFSLSTSNYLYDIRPHKTDFAAYAAMQSAIGATAIFLGAMAGGLLATHAGELSGSLPDILQPTNVLFIVFLASGLMRALVALWFIPRAVEPRTRKRPELRQIIYRVARINPVSGVVLDWLTVARKPSTGSPGRHGRKNKPPHDTCR